MIRDVLLAAYIAGWLLVVGLTALRGNEIQPELWAVGPGGIGLILAAFRADEKASRQPGPANTHQGDDS